jgi:hypothetical protein
MHAAVEAYYSLDSQAQFHISQRMFKLPVVQHVLMDTLHGVACDQPIIQTQQDEVNHG